MRLYFINIFKIEREEAELLVDISRERFELVCT